MHDAALPTGPEARTGADPQTPPSPLDQEFPIRIDRRLTLVVSHRLSTITHADCIHVLDHGAICESGTHDELCRRDGLYAALWRQQGGASGEQAQEA